MPSFHRVGDYVLLRCAREKEEATNPPRGGMTASTRTGSDATGTGTASRSGVPASM